MKILKRKAKKDKKENYKVLKTREFSLIRYLILKKKHPEKYFETG